MQIPGIFLYQGRFSILFVINCHLGGHLGSILILFGYKLSVFIDLTS